MFMFMVIALVAAIATAACGGDGEDTAAPGGTADTMTMESGSGEVGVVSPAADLRVTLDRLLGEHAVLAMLATQKGFSGDADFKQVSAALDANSVDLSEAIASVYGEEAGDKFLNGRGLWRDHIEFFVAYTVGLAEKDKAAQEQAVTNLQGYIGAFSTFLADATGLPADALRQSITEHVNQLKGQIDAYAAGDYQKAYRFAREAYAHMYMTGDTLAAAMVTQSPEKFASS
jgi:hypothetical protein